MSPCPNDQPAIQPTKEPTPLQGALAAASRGWPVFPLTTNNSVAPCKAWQTIATTTRTQLNEWWSTNPLYNIGIACGPAGLVVIRLDTFRRPISVAWAKEGVAHGRDVIALAARSAGEPDSIDTYTVLTPSGEDRYFLAPPGLRLHTMIGASGHGVGPAVDVHAWGGFVAGAGSRRIINGTAHTYRIDLERPSDPTPLPDWLTTLLTPALQHRPRPAGLPIEIGALSPRPLRTERGRGGPDVTAAVRKETAAIVSAANDARARVTFNAAATLGSLVETGMLDQTTAEAALLAAALRHSDITDHTTRNALRHIRNGIARGRTALRQEETNAA